jgi:hypothetical protein
MSYTVVNRNVKAGWFTTAEDKIEKVIQPFLDDGSKKGWRLHSFSATEASKGINLVFIWEHDTQFK